MVAAKTGESTAVRISVPARADVVHVVRSVVGGTAALQDASYEVIEDLRLSADEACAHLLLAVPQGSRLILQVTPAGDTVDIVASIDAEIEDWPSQGAKESLAWYVLTALAEDAAFVRWEGRPAIRFTKRLRDG